MCAALKGTKYETVPVYTGRYGLGSKDTDPEWQAQFQGATDVVSVTKDGGTINAITGSTITSRAVCDGVNAARAVVEALG